MDKSTTNIKKNKLNKCLKYLALVQLAILIIVFYTLLSKYYNFLEILLLNNSLLPSVILPTNVNALNILKNVIVFTITITNNQNV